MADSTRDLLSRAQSIPPSITRVLANSAMGVEGLIPLWFGEPNQPTPAFICQAAAAAMEAGETGYAEGLGRPYLREAIADYMTGLYGREVSKASIAVTVSGGNALNLAFQALLEQGDRVVTLTPAFPNLLRIPELQGAEVITHALEIRDGRWTLDCDAFLQAAEGAKVVLINSPSNPTGFMLELDQMRYLMTELRRRGTWLISDEVYARTVYDREVAPSFLQVAEPDDRLIVVNSFSKTWAMTGWRLGWLTLPEYLVPVVEKIAEFSVACAPPFAQRAGVAAIEQGEPFVEAMREEYLRARNQVVTALNEFPRVVCPAPASAFYAFFRIEGVTDSVAFARALVERARVGLAPGDAFLVGENGWFRLCFAQTEAQLSEALRRLAPFLANPDLLMD